VNGLTIDDTILLGILQDKDAISKQKSIKVSVVLKESEYTEAKFRKSIDRLTALQFIVLNKDYKEHGVFISEYGVVALKNTLETMGG
jgi:hypothetical protein